MFKIEELSGSLIRSGRLHDAVPVFYQEIRMAQTRGVITEDEVFVLCLAFSKILLVPNVDDAEELSEQMIKLAMRVPGLIQTVTLEEFEANVKASREAN